MSAAPPFPAAAPVWRAPHQWRLWLAGLIGSRYDGLRHFAVVEPGVLMRCGQPRIADLDHILKTHGLRTVVVARGGTRHPLRGRWFRRERRWCAARGVALEHMPFSDARTPPADVFERFLSLVGDPARQPILVHCEQGWHRTGVLCAAYRIAVDRWTPQAALAEMAQAGFQMDRAKRRPLIDALLDWAARQTR